MAGAIGTSSRSEPPELAPATGVLPLQEVTAQCLGPGYTTGDPVAVRTLIEHRFALQAEAQSKLGSTEEFGALTERFGMLLEEIMGQRGFDYEFHLKRLNSVQPPTRRIGPPILGQLEQQQGQEAQRIARSSYHALNQALESAAVDPRAQALRREMDDRVAELLAREYPCHASLETAIAERTRGLVSSLRDLTGASAALATVLSNDFSRPTTELDVLKQAVTGKEVDVTAAVAVEVTLEELRAWAESFGVQAVGAELDLAMLQRLDQAVIVHLKTGGNESSQGDGHAFAVFNGLGDDLSVSLGDPLQGNRLVPAAEFLKEWSGNALVLRRPTAGAR